MHTRSCDRRLLASGDFALVEMCDCGAVHLTVGAITLRLAAATLPALAEVVGAAASELALHELLDAHRPSRAEVRS